jgi:hypothetical protein
MTPSFSGSGITVTSTTITSATEMSVTINIGPSANAGLHDFRLLTAAGNLLTFSNQFTVTSSSGGPTVTEMVANYGYKGTVTNVIVNGTGFVATPQVIFSGSGVTGMVTYLSSTQLRVAVTISADDTTLIGNRTITVINPDNTVGALEGGFEIKAASTSGQTIKDILFGPNPLTRNAGDNVTIQFQDTSTGLIEIPVVDSAGAIRAKLRHNTTSPGLQKLIFNTVNDVIQSPLGNGAYPVLFVRENKVINKGRMVIAK